MDLTPQEINYFDALKRVAEIAREDMKKLDWELTVDGILEFLATRVHEDLREEIFQMPFINDKGYVEYEGKGWFYDWSGDLAYAPLNWATNEPDFSNECKACDDAEPVSDEVIEEIMSLIK